MRRRRRVLASLWLEKWAAQHVEDEDFSCGASTDEPGRDGDGVPGVDADHTPVEELVVNAAEAQGVVDGVWTLERPPADVGGIEGNGLRPEAAVVATHGAAVLVGHEDQVPEGGVPSAE
jgi:hypothetical protein